jgi:hypothetical protein
VSGSFGDIVAFEPETLAIKSLCEVKTVTSAHQSSFSADGDCADVLTPSAPRCAAISVRARSETSSLATGVGTAAGRDSMTAGAPSRRAYGAPDLADGCTK